VLAVTVTSRAAQALASIVDHFPAPDEYNGNLQLVDSWTEGEDTICIVYEGWWHGGRLGLRRMIDSDLPVDVVVGQVLEAELGEPPGAMIDGVVEDSDGVTWWAGEPREWWHR
jgi:hypothetical protein